MKKRHKSDYAIYATVITMELIGVLGLVGACANLCDKPSETTETVTYVTPVEEEYTYVILDAKRISGSDTEMLVTMQNGEVEIYSAEDLPTEVSEVCFRTTNLDDFTTYEIVAIR